jgi:hypothetical protein
MPPIHFTPTPAQQASIEALLQQHGNANPTAFIAEAVEEYITKQDAFNHLKHEVLKGVDSAKGVMLHPFDGEKLWNEVQEDIANGVAFKADANVTGE